MPNPLPIAKVPDLKLSTGQQEILRAQGYFEKLRSWQSRGMLESKEGDQK